MPPRDPLTYPKGGTGKYDNLPRALKENDKNPPIGLTQGGSSRKYAGAKPAATNGLWRPKRKRT